MRRKSVVRQGLPVREQRATQLRREEDDFLEQALRVHRNRHLRSRREDYRDRALAIAQHIAAAADLETSLRLLKTDYVDLWQMHDIRTLDDVQAVLKPGGAMEAFEAAKKAEEQRAKEVEAEFTRVIAEKGVNAIVGKRCDVIKTGCRGLCANDVLVDIITEEQGRVTYDFVTPEEVEKIVREVIGQTGAQGAKDMGKVMKALVPVLAGRADNKLVSELVKSSLG